MSRNRTYSKSWQSATLTKKLWSKSKGLPSPSGTTEKTFSNPKTLSVNYARPESALAYLSQAAKSLSNRPEKFDSRRLARSTFLAVNVTLYAAFPSSFLPAPSRLPPHFGGFFI